MPDAPQPSETQLIVDRARVLDGGTDAVIATDREGVIVYWSESAEALYGWPRGEVVGREILEVMPSDESYADAEEVMRHLMRGVSWSGRIQLRTRGGARVVAEVRDVPVRGSSGDLIGIIGVSRRAAS